MSKKHYVEMAKIIKKAVDSYGDYNEAYAAITEIASNFAESARTENSLFDRSRFYTACGL